MRRGTKIADGRTAAKLGPDAEVPENYDPSKIRRILTREWSTRFDEWDIRNLADLAAEIGEGTTAGALAQRDRERRHG
jgi:hypothetical protein